MLNFSMTFSFSNPGFAESSQMSAFCLKLRRILDGEHGEAGEAAIKRLFNGVEGIFREIKSIRMKFVGFQSVRQMKFVCFCFEF